MDSFPLYTKYVSMKHDVKLRARPVVKRIEDPEEIEEIFDPVTYQKVRWENVTVQQEVKEILPRRSRLFGKIEFDDGINVKEWHGGKTKKVQQLWLVEW